MSEAGAAVPQETVERRRAAGMARRHRAERRFRAYGIAAVGTAVAMLLWLLLTVVGTGYTAFQQTGIRLAVHFDPEVIDPAGRRDAEALRGANYAALYRRAIEGLFPEVEGRRDRRLLHRLVSPGGDLELRGMVLGDPGLIGSTREILLTASDDLDQYHKGRYDPDSPEDQRPFKDRQVGWYERLLADGRVESGFNTTLFTAGASREAEQAGIWGAVVGSFWTMLVTLLLSFPVGVAAAVYLEEFAPRNRLTDFIEVNINNLAAVPSIVFGLLGLAVFLNLFGLPRSAPLVGGIVLALMTLPTVIIATRAAIKSVPPSIREAALGVGASELQTTTHHVLPFAFPGILTGTIIGMAQALGETAPLLMIGMVAFVVDIPGGPLSASTVLPVQIFLWSDLPERAFAERTGAAIIILLGFLVAMNLAAVVLRRRFERRW